MEISRDLLNNLNVSDYDRLKSLRRRINLFRVIFCSTAAILTIALYYYLILLIYNWLGKDAMGCLTVFVVYSFLALLGVMAENYPNFFDYVFRNTALHLEIGDLQAEFSEIEKQVTQQLRKYVQGEAASVVRKMKWGISNARNCDFLGAELLKNDVLVNEASKVLSESQLRKEYERILKNEKVSIKDGAIRMLSPEKQFIDESPAYREKRSWWNKRRNDDKPISLNIETEKVVHPRQSETANSSETKIPEPITKRKSPTPQTFTVATDKYPRQHQLFEEPENSAVPRRAATRRRSSETTTETTRAEEPPKIKMPRQGRVFQPSADYYRRVADRKMEIGKRGELFVMEHEKQRLISEGYADLLNRLEHSSLVVGDGLGYDILSFENETEIYIEVKTTVGNFSSSVYFTENEFKVMKKHKGNYYLYRVYEFDEANNTGQIMIFKGKEMIESYFDFSPKVYVLTRKAN